VSASPPARSAERFRLSGPSVTLDPRVHAYRADIADVALAGSLFAPHYSRPEMRSCSAVTATVYSAPSAEAPAVSQLIFGESFAVLDVSGPWAWGYSRHDHYVGHVACDALHDETEPTHIVSAPAALVFAAPSIKAPVLTRLPMGARLAGRVEGEFLVLDRGFVHRRHISALDVVAADPVTVAEALVGAPYLWGGRSGDGIDCSGLVQLAHSFAGKALPRDSDQQAAVGAGIPDDEPLARGDLVLFPGHVGMMVDAARLVHANAFWMAVTIEPLADVVARGAVITNRRRL
jgi:hypothetical protein